MATFSTSLVITELSPNTGIKELIVVTPDTAGSGTVLTITLRNHGISDTGLLTVQSLNHTTKESVIARENAVTTSVSAGVLTITSGTGTGIKTYRILGESN